MRIHTDKPTEAMHAAYRKAPQGVDVQTMGFGSRSRKGAFELRLEGTSNRRVNAGTSQDVDRFNLPYAATWDEWGVVLAAIFEADPEATCQAYDGAEDFHDKTDNRFRDVTLPEDTHQDHRWEFAAPRVFACKDCTATKRR